MSTLPEIGLGHRPNFEAIACLEFVWLLEPKIVSG
jgi:hypothetical protein